MVGHLRAMASPQTPCKCCGGPAPLFGVVDFHKSCDALGRNHLGVSGIPIYYHRCRRCQFLFTTAFDRYSKEDWRRLIYNEEYRLIDPEYECVRPSLNAGFLARLFPGPRPPRLLDYGGGNGLLAELLLRAGFPHVDTYDPFAPEHATRPSGRYDCVVCFEVVEHTTDPRGTFAEMNEMLTEDGLLLFSTLLQPEDLDRQGLSWWYVGPRNGHVSLFTAKSLVAAVRPLGLTFGSFGQNTHVLFRRLPAFARHLLKSEK